MIWSFFFFWSQFEPLAVCGTGVRDREAERKYLFKKERGESTIRKSPKDRDRNVRFRERVRGG